MTVMLTKSNLPATTPDTVLIDFPESFRDKFDRLSVLKHQRSEIEKEEKALKAEILGSLPSRDARKGVKYVLACAGAIRAAVRVDRKETVKVSDLKDAFPEAAQALVKETFYDVIAPA